ncbi:hypothetical protein [Deinococcus pimensis]|uniref:hypothetical protein n=1 Tax=Deinococcus pimensis TaxID=309888 RepID=UPI0004AF79F8|nr:hypothetical protein [Deinococcus pimensis]
MPTYLRTRTPGVTLTARERALAGVGRCAVRVTMTWHNADTPDRRELLRMN